MLSAPLNFIRVPKKPLKKFKINNSFLIKCYKFTWKGNEGVDSKDDQKTRINESPWGLPVTRANKGTTLVLARMGTKSSFTKRGKGCGPHPTETH